MKREATHEQLPRADEVDVLLLLEGTYPYVSGGVSSWVHDIIRGFPDIRFGAIFMGSQSQAYGEIRYPLPENLVHLEVHYLLDNDSLHAPRQPRAVRAQPKTLETIREMHALLRESTTSEDIHQQLSRLISECHPDGKLNRKIFMHSRESWDYIADSYYQFCNDPSFIDYFWTVRLIHAPIWRVLDIARNSIKARMYHSVSTGYAGLLGACLKTAHGLPFLLSEHGIYTKERRIDLYQAQWLNDNRSRFEKDSAEISYFRRMWVQFFEQIGRLAYHMADDIVALYEANRLRQIADGAPAERTLNIPNGINVEAFAPLRVQRPDQNGESPPLVFCLIGRVVPIKDIKTFIRAAHIVVNRMPGAQAWIAGPTEEDPKYVEECRMLVEHLGLEDKVQFLGYQVLVELLPKVGLVVLSSISEALPLVLLEGYAAGVPAVTTDVGSCRQLIYGLDDEDRAIGASGQVVQIANPQQLADAIVELLGDEAAWHQASAAAIHRVERYYRQERMYASYQALYDKALTSSCAESSELRSSQSTQLSGAAVWQE